jgi:hypothetical protein
MAPVGTTDGEEDGEIREQSIVESMEDIALWY